MIPRSKGRGPALAGLAVAVALISTSSTEAGWPSLRRQRAAAPAAYVARSPVPTNYVPPGNAPTPMLGSFYSTPYMTVRSNGVVGGGYSPGGLYGAQHSLAMYGPMSPLRANAAPVVVYQRGYNGVVQPGIGTSFSTPIRPEITPVIYPTRRNLYGSFPNTRTPPWWQSSFNFLDFN